MKLITPTQTTSWKTMLLYAAAIATAAGGGGGSFVVAAEPTLSSAFVGVPSKRQTPSMYTSMLPYAGRKYRSIAAHPTTTARFFSSGSDDIHIDDAYAGKMPFLPELNAIKILRAHPRRYNHINNNRQQQQQQQQSNHNTYDQQEQRGDEEIIKACHTAVDVLHLLHRAVSVSCNDDEENELKLLLSPSTLAALSKSEMLSPFIESIVDDVSPNIAAAALRRLSSPPFLPPTTSLLNSRRTIRTRRRPQRRADGDVAVSPIEREVYDQLMHLLLNKVTATMELQLDNVNVVSSSSSSIAQHHDRDNHKPTLLPVRDTWKNPPTSSSSSSSSVSILLNWYALADLLYSLSNLCNFLQSSTVGNKNFIKGHLLTNISPREQGSIVTLFDTIVEYVSLDDKLSSSFVRCVGPRRLVRDVVGPMVSMQMVRRRKLMQGMQEGLDNELVDTEEGMDDVDDECAPSISLSNDNDKSSSSYSYNHLMTIVSSYLANPNSLEKLTGPDISITLWSMTRIYHPLSHQQSYEQEAKQEPLKLQSEQRLLLRAFMKRLRKVSVRAPTEGRDLVQAISSASRLIGFLKNQQDQTLTSSWLLKTEQQTTTPPVLPLPTIRLPGEDGDYSTTMEDIIAQTSSPSAVTSSSKTEQSMSTTPAGSSNHDATSAESIIPTEILQKEATIMFHTLLNDIVNPPYAKEESTRVVEEIIKLHSLSIAEIADILQSATSLGTSHDDITVPMAEILKYLTTNPSSSQSPLQQCRKCKDISRLLLSFQRLRVGSGIFDKILEKQCVQLLGERFLEIVLWHRNKEEQQQQQSPRLWVGGCCDAKTLAIILRSGVLMYQGNSSATSAMLDAASILIRDDNEAKSDIMEDDDLVENWDDFSSFTFLSMCNEFEISNYLFAFAMAKRFDESVFISLIDQMVEEEILESCTPSSASRALWSCAMIMSLDEVGRHIEESSQTPGEFALGSSSLFTTTSSFLHERQIDLFHQLAPLLLSSSLSPTDTSSAMWAMAKAEYVIDQGIFDQLAETMASTDMLDRANTRLVSQALWACGKMVEFEVQSRRGNIQYGSEEGEGIGPDEGVDESEEEGALNQPPYVQYAGQYINFLLTNESQMTPKHIAQSIWAMGRLRIMDFKHEMGGLAIRRCENFNAQEIANIVWGLSKIGYDNPEIITSLIQRISTSANLAEETTAQEASNMLYALGRLQLRNEEAFASLSTILKNSLHEANSQSIANALWAHEVVDIAAPPELLQLWAQDRLGLNMNVENLGDLQ